MATSFSHLEKSLSTQSQKAAKEKADKMMRKLALFELRKLLNINQEQLAALCNTKQANISRIERRKDMNISTLKSYIEALGGQLDIIARFPEENFTITQFKK